MTEHTFGADNRLAIATNDMDTPETDKAERMAYAGEYMVPTEFARRVERERDEWARLCGQYKQERDKFAELSKQASQGINSTYQNIQYLLGALIAARNERDDAREMLQQYMFDRSGTWIDFSPADKPTP